MSWSTTDMLRRLEPPQGRVISLDDLRLHLKVDGNEEDGRIRAYLDAATAAAEERTGWTLLPTRIEARFAAFASILAVPASPLREVETVSYRAADGSAVDLAPSAYEIVETSEGFDVRFAADFAFPATASVAEPVSVTFLAGFDAVDPVPETALLPPDPRDQHMILMLVAHWYAVREAVNVGNIVSTIPLGFELLAAQRRIFR